MKTKLLPVVLLITLIVPAFASASSSKSKGSLEVCAKGKSLYHRLTVEKNYSRIIFVNYPLTKVRSKVWRITVRLNSKREAQNRIGKKVLIPTTAFKNGRIEDYFIVSTKVKKC